MSLIHKVEQWGDHHHPAALDVLRILLGIFLVLKGYGFMQNTADLQNALAGAPFVSLPPIIITLIINYVIFIHLTGGLFIMLGILTRLFSLLQLPVVIAAVFMINILKSPFNSALWLSIFVCVLLFIYMILGSGYFSLDRYLKSNSDNDAL